jgi:hypothetical protein
MKRKESKRVVGLPTFEYCPVELDLSFKEVTSCGVAKWVCVLARKCLMMGKALRLD